jgi:hypothetical protein
MHHARFMLLAPLALALAVDGAQASEPARVTPAVATVEGQVAAGGFAVTPVISRRQRDSLEAAAGASMLTMRGTWDCPGGYQPVFQGYVYAFQQKGVDVPQFGGVEPHCWFLPPLETTFLGNWERVSMCVVCTREPGTSVEPPPATGTTPIPGGSTPTPVPDLNSQSPTPGTPGTDTTPISPDSTI